MDNKGNAKRMMAILSLGFAYGIIYLMPYMKTVFYDSMIEATGFTNAQLGYMMTVYALGCTASYVPGGWIADKIRPRILLTVCLLGQAAIAFTFLVTCTNYYISLGLWVLSAICGGFAFWPSMLKAIRMLGTKEEQGRLYGVFEFTNGIASMVSSWIMVFAATYLGNLIGGFQGAVVVMAVLNLLAAGGVFFLYNENNFVDNEPVDEDDVIRASDFAKVLLMPKVWVAGLLLFCAITSYAGLGYIGAYSTEVVGIGVATAGILNSIREYGCRVGGVAGGFFADTVFKSSAKWQVIAQGLCAVVAFSFLLIPSKSTTLFIVVMLFMALCVYANRVTVYSLLSEMKVEAKVAGTALALVTLIGYIPDMFVHTMFGTWLDQYGAAGYDKIFMYLGITAAVGVVIALIAVTMVKKINKQEAEN